MRNSAADHEKESGKRTAIPITVRWAWFSLYTVQLFPSLSGGHSCHFTLLLSEIVDLHPCRFVILCLHSNFLASFTSIKFTQVLFYIADSL